MDAILPGSLTFTVDISLARLVTARRPFSSVKTPAAVAAAYSPRLWPITISGFMPNEVSRRNMAMSAVIMAGWVIWVCFMAFSRFSSSSFDSPGFDQSVSVRFTPIIFSSMRSASSKVDCTTSYLAARSRIMSTYCEPCPGNRKPILASCVLRLKV